MKRRTSTITALISLAVFILMEIFCLLLISNNGVIQKYRVMTQIRTFQRFFWDQGEGIRNFIALKDANEALVQENMRLFNELEMYKQHTSKILSDSLISSYNPNFSYIPATVIKNSTNRRHNYIVIDKGTNDGVKEDMGIITPSGVIGYVHSASKNHSLVVSMLDIDYTATAILKRDGTFGTLHWNGKSVNELTLSEIPIHTTFSIGDTVTTSGYSAIYPKGVEIGTVKSSETVGGTSFDLTISLFEDFSKLHHVYIVNNPNNEEFRTLINMGDSLE